LRYYILAFIIIIWTLSCDSGNAKISIAAENKKLDTLTQNIRFDFTAKYLTGNGKPKFDSLINVDLSFLKYDSLIEVNASLFNDNFDTVYFLHSSCDGTQFLLQYDSTKFTLSPIMYCNASWVVAEKIAPKSKFNFRGYFKNKARATNINLCFDFYRVDKSFDVSKMKLRDIHRTRSDQNLICASEKII
jgi:hypothetical protein